MVHIIYARDDLAVHISLLFTSLFVHDAVTDDFSLRSTVPIPKSNTFGISSSSNYRAIRLSSIFAKVSDRILLDRYSYIINTSRLQFGLDCCVFFCT